MKKLNKRFVTERKTVESMWGMCDYGCNCGWPACPCATDVPNAPQWSNTVFYDEMDGLTNTAYRAEIEQEQAEVC